MSRTAGRGRATFCVALLAVLAFAIRLGQAPESRADSASSPNVLVIVADDQPTGTVKRMPTLNGAEGFTRFNSYYDNNPLCCPTRTTLLTGLYSHHTGVETNLVAKNFDDSSTLATWLDDAGYETGLFGKYLNNYPWDRGANYVPPGWDRWSAFTPDAAYYDYTLVGDGRAGATATGPRTTRPTCSPTRSTGSSRPRPRATTRSSPTSRRTGRTRRELRRRAIATRSRTRG